MYYSLKKLIRKPLFILLITAFVILLCVIYSRYAIQIPSVNSPSSTTSSSKDNKTTAVTPLSPADEAVRRSLLMQTLHTVNQSGVIYKSPNVQVEYVANDDSFQAEILTTHIIAAIQETESWLLGEGLNQHDICSLHLIFYVDPAVKESLPTGSQPVTLLPQGC
jgi:hypothetical protein